MNSNDTSLAQFVGQTIPLSDTEKNKSVRGSIAQRLSYRAASLFKRSQIPTFLPPHCQRKELPDGIVVLMIGGAIPPRMAVNDGAEEPKVPRTPNPSLVDLLNYQNSPMVSSVGLLTPDLNQRLVLSTPQEVNWEVDSQHVDMYVASPTVSDKAVEDFEEMLQSSITSSTLGLMIGEQFEESKEYKGRRWDYLDDPTAEPRPRQVAAPMPVSQEEVTFEAVFRVTLRPPTPMPF